MQLVDNYQSGFQIIKRDMNAVKKSIIPFGLMYMGKMLMSIPSNFVRNFFIGYLSDR